MTDASSLHIAFRVDAALEIGTGHVMRCLTLADALRSRGAECLFLCRPHPGHLMTQIAARGYRVIALGPPRATPTPISAVDPIHAAWLGVDWQEDAAQTLAALADERPDWLVMDHYALDHRWEHMLRPACHRLMVMDDLADRVHDCDLLLDPSLGRKQTDYESLVSASTTLLLGPYHALLRPEFAAYRTKSLARRKTPALHHLLVTMGGVDKDNATGRLLDALSTARLPPDLQITVVMGPHAPWLQDVRAQAARMTIATHVQVGVNDMARLMTESDLAIGAAGSTSWERCCMGLPTIQFVVAANQTGIAAELERAGAAIYATGDLLPEVLVSILENGDVLTEKAKAASLVTDGLGAERVVTELLRPLH